MEQSWIPSWVKTLGDSAIISRWIDSNNRSYTGGIVVYNLLYTKNGREFQIAALDYGGEKDLNVGFLRESAFKFEYPKGLYFELTWGKKEISEEDFLTKIQSLL
jgi:hypothetical protein